MLLLVVFDVMVLGRLAADMVFLRILALCGVALNYLGYRKWGTLKHPLMEKGWVHEILLGLPVYIWTLLYTYLIFSVKGPQNEVYFVGLLLVIGLSSFVVHKFSFLSKFYLMVSLSSFLAMMLWTGQTDRLLTASVGAVVSFALFTLMRMEFKNSIENKFALLSGVLPMRVAETLALSSDHQQHVDLFLPKSRYVACVCADWRGFQMLSERKSAQELSAMLEKFYDEVLEALDRVVPSGNYFVNWTADEVFIVFYDEDNRPHVVLRDAAAFTITLLSEIYDKVEKEFRGEIQYDVGFSAGHGLLGLQGPRSLKKTTIAGEVAGLAKRYQEEAKGIRAQMTSRTSPILVTDQYVLDRSAFESFFPRGDFRSTTAKSKNISGRTCFAWARDFSRKAA